MKVWDAAERCTRPESGVDGVDILAVLEHKQHPNRGEKKVVLALQYRPPMAQLSLEFPAGLVDQKENPAEAAIRELREETCVFPTFAQKFSPFSSIAFILFLTPFPSLQRVPRNPHRREPHARIGRRHVIF